MPGYILLAGGAEFGGKMAEADQQGLRLAGGYSTAVRIIPAAAAPDHNDERAGRNGVRWFTSLGAQNVASLPIIDRDSADDPALAGELQSAGLIYLLGGFPGHLNQTLAGSLCFQAILSAYQRGAVIAGSSAGAMVLCEYFYDPYEKLVSSGLNLVAGACVLPHYHSFGKDWAIKLSPLLPGVTLAGIDEGTAMIDCAEEQSWTVFGAGKVTLHQATSVKVYIPGQTFSLYE